MLNYSNWLTAKPLAPLRGAINQYAEFFSVDLASNSTSNLAIVVCLIVTAAIISLVIVRTLVSRYVTAWVLRSKNNLDDALHRHGFFKRAGHMLPALVISLGAYALIDPELSLHTALLKLSQLYMLTVGLGVVFSIFNIIDDVYASSRMAKRASITGFIQIGKLIFTIITALLCISLIINKSPVILLSGLTAIAAVLLLIFRDTILGFVAGIQIAAYRMFNTGDWIEIPKFNVDGEILEIGLTNVKIQNWDKTISTLPTYALTNESVKNWRGMSDSGGRRIKRAILVDIHTIRLCDSEMLERFNNMRLLKPYINQKKTDLQKYHQDNHIDATDLLNSRQLSNIGTYRAYIEAYLAQHASLHKGMTLMVRQLAPTELGVPLEIYCFSAEQRWIEYEKIQSDLFDHFMAMLPVFELRAFQRDAHLLAQQIDHQ